MVSKLGIIPAAGKSVRFGSIPKMLLPIGRYGTFLDRTFDVLGHCTRKLIVGSNETMVQLMARTNARPDLAYAFQHKDQDIWGAIRESFPFAGDMNYFVMPDTIVPLDAFDTVTMRHSFYLGLHWTEKPERFGMWRGHEVVNKQPGRPGWAWGVLAWSKRVAKFWAEGEFFDYTTAINAACANFRAKPFRMKYYRDMSSMQDYKEFLNETI